MLFLSEQCYDGKSCHALLNKCEKYFVTSLENNNLFFLVMLLNIAIILPSLQIKSNRFCFSKYFSIVFILFSFRFLGYVQLRSFDFGARKLEFAYENFVFLVKLKYCFVSVMTI